MGEKKLSDEDTKKTFSEMRKKARVLFKAGIIDKALYSAIKIAERKAVK